jgi:hypothetical protein
MYGASGPWFTGPEMGGDRPATTGAGGGEDWAQYERWSDDDVLVLPWPLDRDRPRGDDRACLYIVEAGAPPPAAWGADEDWLRAPVDYVELQARRERLRARRLARQPVEIDEFSVARRGDRWVALTPVEAAILAPLLAGEGRLIRRDELEAGSPHGDRGRRIDATIARLRRRVRPLGVTIHTVRAVGFVLEVDRARD